MKKNLTKKKEEILKFNLLHTHLQIQVILRMVAKLQVPRQVFPLGCVHCHNCLKIKTTSAHMTSSECQAKIFFFFFCFEHL